MIKYETIQEAKKGNKQAREMIVNYYYKAITDYSEDEDFVNTAIVNVLQAIDNFRNEKK